MGLSESKKEELEAKDFHVLFSDKAKNRKWVALAHAAQKYAKENITGGEEPRPDDVAEALLPILNADAELRKHQRANRATSTRYRVYFSDYIVDQVIVEPTRGKKKP
jgi:hypothetical protein